MQYLRDHIGTIVRVYTGSLPLAYFLKSYFRGHPKLGSRDRKMLSAMAYSWYRFRKGLPEALGFFEALGWCLWLGGETQKHLQAFLPEGAPDAHSFSLAERMQYPDARFRSAVPELRFSGSMDAPAWQELLATQPPVYFRLMQQPDKALAALKKEGLAIREIPVLFEAEGKQKQLTCLETAPGAPLDRLLLPGQYLVQDLASQLTGQAFRPEAGTDWWDCCSGAGGKSLLLTQLAPSVRLTVSDTRASILENLKARFRQYGFKQPRAFVADLTSAVEIDKNLGGSGFQGIVCDVPCTGSGTWGRTPESAYFFDPATVAAFAARQLAIAANAQRKLLPGGRFLYITCSVFREENENVVEQLLACTELSLESQGLIVPEGSACDRLFVAVLRR